MDILSNLILFTVPAVVVGAVAYLLINKMLNAENRRHNYEVQKIAAKSLVPAKLQAYERMTLFLERIAPESLLTRQNLNGISALQLQSTLLQQIRQEWEHNLAQQLYVSRDAWTIVRNAKEGMVQLINTCAAEASLTSTALDYAKLIIETYNSVEKTPIDIALGVLKADVVR